MTQSFTIRDYAGHLGGGGDRKCKVFFDKGEHMAIVTLRSGYEAVDEEPSATFEFIEGTGWRIYISPDNATTSHIITIKDGKVEVAGSS